MAYPVLIAKNKNLYVSRFQTAPEIAAAIVKAVEESATDAKILAPHFCGDTQKQNARLIFTFIKNAIPYEKEPSSRQTAKTLARMLQDAKKKGGDCKHYATAAAALCKALNIKCKLRLISQRDGDKTPNHIYTIAIIGGREVIIDPVLKTFDTEARYNYKYDININ